MKHTYNAVSGITILLTSVLLPLVLSAQEKMKPGKIDIQDLQMTVCPFDSSAEAMVLGDIGNTHFVYDDENGFMMVFERLLRIKIFSKEGYTWANQEISIYKNSSDEEKFTTLKGRTYNLVNGKIQEDKLDNESIFTEKENTYCTTKRLTFPNVKEGSVIELQYIIRSPFLRYIRPWLFQGSIPKRWSEYEIRIPEFYQYSTQVTGYLPYTIQKHDLVPAVINVALTDDPNSQLNSSASYQHNQVKFTEYTYLLAIGNIPAFKEEPFTSSRLNYINGIRYEFKSYQFPEGALHEMATSWEKVAENLVKDESFGGQIKKKGIVKDIVTDINEKSAVPYDKMLLAYDFVKNNFRWNGKMSNYVSAPLNEVLKNKTGNSADINLLLILILQNLDVQADPVVLSTRQNGMLFENHPSLTDLDYVIASVHLEGKNYLLDATDLSRPFNMLPFRCLNGKGLEITESSTRWIPLLNEEKNSSLYTGDFKIDPEGNISGTLSISLSGYEAISKRNDVVEKGKESCEKEFRENLKNWEVNEIEFRNIESIQNPVITSCKLNSEEMAEINGDMIYFNVLLSLGQKTNPFNTDKREYPVDFGCPVKDYYNFSFEIPEGYQVLSYPESLKVSLEDQSASFKFLTTVADRKISITSVVQINRPVFYTQDYQKLREFFTQVVARHAQQIVLKKS